MKIINFYLTKKYCYILLIIVVSTLFILLITGIFDALHHSFLHRKDYSIILMWVILRLPYVLSQIFPLLITISCTFLLINIKKSSELIVLFSLGISWGKILKILFFISFIASVLSVIILQPIASYCLHIQKKRSDDIPKKMSINLIESLPQSKNFILAKDLDIKKLEFKNIYIINTDKDLNFKQNIIADTGIIQNNKFKLFNVIIYNTDMHKINYDYYELETKIVPYQLISSLKKIEVMNFFFMWGSIKYLKTLGIPSIECEIGFYKLLFRPLITISIIFALVLFFNMEWGNNSNLGINLFINIFLYFIIETIINILSYSGMPVLIAILLPLAIILLSTYIVYDLKYR